MGGGDACPSPPITANPDGFLIKYAHVDRRELRVSVTDAVASIDYLTVYDRWLEKLAGGFTECSGSRKGIALDEEVRL